MKKRRRICTTSRGSRPPPRASRAAARAIRSKSRMCSDTPGSAPNATDIDRKLEDAMAQYRVNFAATGDPNGKGLPAWPAGEGQGDRPGHGARRQDRSESAPDTARLPSVRPGVRQAARR